MFYVFLVVGDVAVYVLYESSSVDLSLFGAIYELLLFIRLSEHALSRHHRPDHDAYTR